MRHDLHLGRTGRKKDLARTGKGLACKALMAGCRRRRGSTASRIDDCAAAACAAQATPLWRAARCRASGLITAQYEKHDKPLRVTENLRAVCGLRRLPHTGPVQNFGLRAACL